MRRKFFLAAACFALVLSFAFIAEAASSRVGFPSVLIEGVPHVRQKPDFCGEACAEMFLRKLGKKVDQDQVFDRAGLDPLLGRGCYTRDLAKALKNIGFKVGPVWYKFDQTKSAANLNRQFRQMHDDLKNGVPSIICMHYDDRPNTTEHFRLILGYDARSDEVVYHEPAVNNGAYRRMKREQLLKLWPLKYSKREWTVVRMPLTASQLKSAPAADGPSDADFAQHIMKLKKQIPNKDFHVLIQKPFVVLGDESPKTVQRRATRTIKWAVGYLKKDYFKKDPNEIIDI